MSDANDIVTAGYYEATTLSGVDADLIEDNILSGKTIFGVGGTLSAASGLPDTNQVTCYNDTAACTCGAAGCTGDTDWPNQTAQNAEDGNRDNDFTVDAAVCGTAGSVYDSLTGLCWEKDAGTTTLNWKAALQECNNLSLSGYTDWRLPKAIELVSIVDYGYEDSSYWHAAKFLNETGDYYWSSTTLPNATSFAYLLHFSYGNLYYDFKTDTTYYVVCVRDK